MKLLAAALLAVALAGCAADTEPAEPGPVAENPTVTLENISFSPDVVTIEPGTTVTWEWDDGSTQHDVVFDDFESEIQSEGTYTHTFDETGTYEYVCSLHPNMTGTVFVVDSES